MIYITLGTQACDFSRCMKMVEELISEMNITDKIVAQTGYTSYHPKRVECFDFVSEDKYQQLMADADIVISHAGTGALFSSIRKGKKVIAVARLAKYGEMINDHQTEIVRKLSSEGYILDGTQSLLEAWKKLDSFIPRPYDFECTIPQHIDGILFDWGLNESCRKKL